VISPRDRSIEFKKFETAFRDSLKGTSSLKQQIGIRAYGWFREQFIRNDVAQVDEVELRQLEHPNQSPARSAGCVGYS
jgi:hypothetical protein